VRVHVIRFARWRPARPRAARSASLSSSRETSRAIASASPGAR
jgi:hypothetical protein